MSKHIFLEERKYIWDIGGVADYYLSRLLASAFTWSLLEEVLTPEATGGHYMNKPSIQGIITAQPNMLLCFIKIKCILKYFPELMHFNRLWLRTRFRATRRAENKVLGWHLRFVFFFLTQFVFFFPTGTREFVSVQGSFWRLCIHPFILNQSMSALVLNDNTGDCNFLLLRWLVDYHAKNSFLKNCKWGGRRKFSIRIQREMIALLQD